MQKKIKSGAFTPLNCFPGYAGSGTPESIKIRSPVGAALPFSKITPATITTTNTLS